MIKGSLEVSLLELKSLSRPTLAKLGLLRINPLSSYDIVKRVLDRFIPKESVLIYTIKSEILPLSHGTPGVLGNLAAIY